MDYTLLRYYVLMYQHNTVEGRLFELRDTYNFQNDH